MSPGAGLAAAWQLARPRQWPILSAQFAVGAALALPPGAAAGDALTFMTPVPLAAGWFCWVVLLNGGTLAYNSAWDRDTDAVAYLRRPPQPPPWLASASLAVMVAGAALGSVAIGPVFGAVTGMCVLLSVAYSHPRPRWKGRPGLDLLTNMLGYGAGTTAAGLLAGQAALPVPVPGPSVPAVLMCASFGLLFGSFYPLTQIYQVAADRARGDRTLSTRLGAAGALNLALGLGLGSVMAMQIALALRGGGPTRGLPAAAMFLWLVHLWRWRAGCGAMAPSAHEKGMYRALGLWAAVDVALVFAWLG